MAFADASTSPYSLWAANALTDKDGDIRINAAQQSKLDGIEQCNEVSTPLISTCKRSSDVVFQGECMRLPELRLQVRDAEFIEPLGPPDNFLEYDEYSVRPLRDSWMNYGDRGVLQVASVTEEGVRPKFLPPANVDASPPDVLTARNVGLTRAFLGWEVRWDNVSSDIHDVIDGFMIFVYPDQKSSKVLVPEGGFGFHLPKLVQVEHNNDGDDDMRYSTVDGFSVGGLYHYPVDSRLAQEGSDSLVWESSDDHEYTKQVPIGGKRVRDDYEGFNKLIHNMPLAPGFVHGFEVAPYVGKPFGSDFKLGPRSEKIILNGDHIACDEVPELPAPGHVHPPPPAVDPTHSHAFEKIRKLYDCGESSTPGALGYDDDGFRPGLLALTGTDICTDIFSSTPARFTWDNSAVHRVWGFVWIIAGSVLFTLLVWQGLRMTYDVWLDPQPSVGFRELVPRFLLAAALAASSLIICRMVLVAASDLTCFVAQSTHMTMWGVIDSTFGALVGGFTSWYQGAVAEDVSFLQRFEQRCDAVHHGDSCAGRPVLHNDPVPEGPVEHAPPGRVVGDSDRPVSVGFRILCFGCHVPLDEEMGDAVFGDHLPAGDRPGRDLPGHQHNGRVFRLRGEIGGGGNAGGDADGLRYAQPGDDDPGDRESGREGNFLCVGLDAHDGGGWSHDGCIRRHGCGGGRCGGDGRWRRRWCGGGRCRRCDRPFIAPRGRRRCGWSACGRRRQAAVPVRVLVVEIIWSHR